MPVGYTSAVIMADSLFFKIASEESLHTLSNLSIPNLPTRLLGQFDYFYET